MQVKMIQKRAINLEAQDEPFSAEDFKWFNGHLTRKMSGDLFSEKPSESTQTRDNGIVSFNNPEEQVGEMLNLDKAYQEPQTQLGPASQDTSAESQRPADGNRKNICGYVFKQALDMFYESRTRRMVEKQCRKQGIAYEAVIRYFQQTMPKVLGVKVLAETLTAKTNFQMRAKKVFRKFLRWFLRKHYMLNILTSGKMKDKKSYIEVKNRKLLYFQYELDNTLLSMNSIKD